MRGTPSIGVYPPGFIDRYVEIAGSRGVTELGFTEHLYRCIEAAEALGPWWERETSTLVQEQTRDMVERERNLSLERYVEVVLEAKSRGLPVKLGLEVDFEPGREREIVDLISPFPWDFLVGSVHWIDGWHFGRADAGVEFRRRGVDTVWRQYFELETALAASRLVDVLGHVDVVKSAGLRPDQSLLEELYRPLVAASVASGVAIEVSSGGLRRESNEIFPAPGLLAMFGEAAVPITLASDAHTPNQAAWGHNLVVASARAAGYSTYLRFEGRQRIPTSLDRD